MIRLFARRRLTQKMKTRRTARPPIVPSTPLSTLAVLSDVPPDAGAGSDALPDAPSALVAFTLVGYAGAYADGNEDEDEEDALGKAIVMVLVAE
jgi:hypothetical protein